MFASPDKLIFVRAGSEVSSSAAARRLNLGMNPNAKLGTGSVWVIKTDVESPFGGAIHLIRCGVPLFPDLGNGADTAAEDAANDQSDEERAEEAHASTRSFFDISMALKIEMSVSRVETGRKRDARKPLSS